MHDLLVDGWLRVLDGDYARMYRERNPGFNAGDLVLMMTSPDDFSQHDLCLKPGGQIYIPNSPIRD